MWCITARVNRLVHFPAKADVRWSCFGYTLTAGTSPAAAVCKTKQHDSALFESCERYMESGLRDKNLLRYSEDLNSELVWYLNGGNEVGRQKVP